MVGFQLRNCTVTVNTASRPPRPSLAIQRPCRRLSQCPVPPSVAAFFATHSPRVLPPLLVSPCLSTEQDRQHAVYEQKRYDAQLMRQMSKERETARLEEKEAHLQGVRLKARFTNPEEARLEARHLLQESVQLRLQLQEAQRTQLVLPVLSAARRSVMFSAPRT